MVLSAPSLHSTFFNHKVIIMANAAPKHEVMLGDEGDWRLCFQWAEYTYDDGSSDLGYRFIWRDSDGNQRPHRAQARIPKANDLLSLLGKAAEEGWLGNCESE